MARGACTFKQRDLTAAIKAARAAGVEVQRVEIDRDGKIVIQAAAPTELQSPSEPIVL
jgi:hypothetical protein